MQRSPIGEKIKKLMNEGHSENEAVAILLKLAENPRGKKARKL